MLGVKGPQRKEKKPSSNRKGKKRKVTATFSGNSLRVFVLSRYRIPQKRRWEKKKAPEGKSWYSQNRYDHDRPCCLSNLSPILSSFEKNVHSKLPGLKPKREISDLWSNSKGLSIKLFRKKKQKVSKYHFCPLPLLSQKCST